MQVMNEKIQSVNGSRGEADFHQAVKMAFETFSNSTECHKMLVVVTDNDADSTVLQEAVNQFNRDMEVTGISLPVSLVCHEKLLSIASYTDR